MHRNVLVIITTLLAVACSSAHNEDQAAVAGGAFFCPMHVERLSDLNSPRGGGVLRLLDGELTIFGGHTDGFIPLATAEYLKDGSWHEISSTYSHDYGFVAELPDGKVMLGGGAGESFGIGQSWGVEVYDPQNHMFRSIGILDRKRTGVSALALKDGRVLVSGNWYAEDSIETIAPESGTCHVQDVAEPRCCPLILQTGPEDYIIFGSEDNYGNLTGCMVDRLGGEPYLEPILEEWAVIRSYLKCPEEMKIGEFDYLCMVSSRCDKSRIKLLRVDKGRFSLLDTEYPFPVFGPDSTAIDWTGRMVVDRQARQAWFLGFDTLGRVLLAQVHYDPIFEGNRAGLKIWIADCRNQPAFYLDGPVLLGDGRFAFAGGMRIAADGITNFETSRKAYVFSTQERKNSNVWWLLAITVLLAGLAAYLMTRSRKERTVERSPAPKDDLMSRIIKLMEEDELFRQKGLTKADVAKALGTNVSYVSACINAQLGKSFPDFVAGYRVRHAQNLMKLHPEMLMSEVGEESGFANEQSFFRSFKAFTGMPPTEWKNTY